jgi:hypothetical protein
MWLDEQRRGARVLGAAVCVIALVGCASQPEGEATGTAGEKRGAIGKSDYPVNSDIARQTGDPYTDLGENQGSLLDLTTSFDFPWSDDDDEAETAAVAPGGAGIQVNGDLWGAALDTIAFMPLETADPQGGIIKTGWYSEPDQPDQRYRVNVFIVSGQLRSDGVRVSVFRQIRNEADEWVDAAPPEETASALKDVILRRARELGMASTG